MIFQQELCRPETNGRIYLSSERKKQPRLLDSTKISVRFKEEIKSFIDKQKLTEFSTTKSALQQMLKGFLDRKHKRRKRKTDLSKSLPQITQYPIKPFKALSP